MDLATLYRPLNSAVASTSEKMVKAKLQTLNIFEIAGATFFYSSQIMRQQH